VGVGVVVIVPIALHHHEARLVSSPHRPGNVVLGVFVEPTLQSVEILPPATPEVTGLRLRLSVRTVVGVTSGGVRTVAVAIVATVAIVVVVAGAAAAGAGSL